VNNVGIKEDVIDVKEEVEEMSFAMEMLKFSKKQLEINNNNLDKANKRLFIIILILVLCLGTSVAYNIYLLNDISTVETETTQEVSDVETVEGNIVNNGDIYGKDKTDSKNKKEN
jgi:hypothetical protein